VIYLVAVLIACSIGLLTLAVAQLIPARSAAVDQRLIELQQISSGKLGGGPVARRGTRARPVAEVIRSWERRSERAAPTAAPPGSCSSRPASAARCRLGLLGCPDGASGGAGSSASCSLRRPGSGHAPHLRADLRRGFGWIAPPFYVGGRREAPPEGAAEGTARCARFMVVCVEAGLGLNQAIVRVSDEIRHISELMSQELALVNFEIRAGTPREDALRNLGERTGWRTSAPRRHAHPDGSLRHLRGPGAPGPVRHPSHQAASAGGGGGGERRRSRCSFPWSSSSFRLSSSSRWVPR
jgi:hypothetical protein